MLNHSPESAGRLIARTLAGSWRANPRPLDLRSHELSSIKSQLMSAGVAGLTWRRLRQTTLSETDSAAELRAEYERNAVRAVFERQRIESVICALHAAGVKAMIVKGWAAARLYPDEGLRPYVDIDVCVERRQLALARNVLKILSDSRVTVDLHCEFATLGGGTWEQVYSRTQTMRMSKTDVRVPRPEDHLRILSIHMLREGAWRPLWLCDVAAAVESGSADFDWRVCLGQNRQWSNWVVCAVRLAHELLGAEINGTPATEDRKALPRWLIPSVLREWGSSSPAMTLRHRAPMASQLRSPATLLAGLLHRWPNPIEGTVIAGGLINELPRFPFQLAAYLMRGARFALPHPKS